jgi:vacuolar-type H+-ATPase subunit E/Vma4
MDLDDILEDIIDDEFQNEAPNFEAEVTVKTANEVSEQKREDRTPNKSMTLLKS